MNDFAMIAAVTEGASSAMSGARRTKTLGLPLRGALKLPLGSEGDLGDWVCRIQAACSGETNSVLDLADLMRVARLALPRGGWSALWRTKKIACSKRKGEKLVAIGIGFDGLNANDRSHLPGALNTLYCLARMGREAIGRLIAEGRIHPGLRLREAEDLMAEYDPAGRAATSRSNFQIRLARFAGFVRKNLDSWSEQERKMVADELAALVGEIQAAASRAARVSKRISTTGNSPGAAIETLAQVVPRIVSIQPDPIRWSL